MSAIGDYVDVPYDFDTAIEKVTEVLGKEGFGVLSRINVHEALKNKLNIDFQQFAILGACNPSMAHKALTANPHVGLLMPCNVCVEQREKGSRVYLVNARTLLGAGEVDAHPAIAELGEDATARLERAAAALAADQNDSAQ